MSKIKLVVEMEELSYKATLEYRKLSFINENDLTEMILNAKIIKESEGILSIISNKEYIKEIIYKKLGLSKEEGDVLIKLCNEVFLDNEET